MINPPATNPPQLAASPQAVEQPDASRAGVDKVQPPSLYSLVAEQKFFAGLNASQLQLLAESAMEQRFEAGESIMQEGSPANRFYLILEGKVLLESEVNDRSTVPIQTLGPGDDLGWSWLFPPYHLHFSVRALEPTRTIFFYGTRLRAQCEENHEFGYQLMVRITGVLIQSLRATQQRLMACSPPGGSNIDPPAVAFPRPIGQLPEEKANASAS